MLKNKTKDEINIVTSKVVDELLKQLSENVYKVILYGSYARGDFTNESDIDIMVLLNCDKDNVALYRKQTSRIASRISLENDVEVSILLRDKDTFESKKRVLSFYNNIQKEGVSLYGWGIDSIIELSVRESCSLYQVR